MRANDAHLFYLYFVPQPHTGLTFCSRVCFTHVYAKNEYTACATALASSGGESQSAERKSGALTIDMCMVWFDMYGMVTYGRGL
jgi:hypothetical protein